MSEFIQQIIFSSALIQGLILIIFLLRKRINLYPNIILSVFISVILIQVAFRLISIYPLGIYYPFFDIANYLPYLYGPLAYLYLKTSLNNYKLKPFDAVHLLPFVISVMIVITAGYRFINIFSYINVDVYNICDTLVQLAVLSLYLSAGKKMLKKNSSGENDYEKPVAAPVSFWFKRFINIVFISGTLIIILFTLIFYKTSLPGIHYSNLQLILAVMTAAIYFLTYEALVRPEVFYQFAELNAGRKNTKSGNNPLTQKEITLIIEKLEFLINADKLYLDSSVNLESVSKSTGVSRHHISRAINQELKINFNDYINSKRIEYAKKELVNPAKKNLTIAAIAFESGFNSISAFNDAFKKHTSLTPSVFKKRYKNT